MTKFTGWVTEMFTFCKNGYTVAMAFQQLIIEIQWLPLTKIGFLMHPRCLLLWVCKICYLLKSIFVLMDTLVVMYGNLPFSVYVSYTQMGFFFPAKPTSTHTYGKKARIFVSGHETRSTGSLNSEKKPCGPGFMSWHGDPSFFGMQVPVDRVSSSCQDMKPSPWELAFRKNSNLHVRTWNLVHRAIRCTTISSTGPIYAKSSDFYEKLNVSNLNVTNLY
jgi:hypothetical protein